MKKLYDFHNMELTVAKDLFFNIQLPQARIDLRYVLAHVGYKGGLKKCESLLGIDRGNLYEFLDGRVK